MQDLLTSDVTRLLADTDEEAAGFVDDVEPEEVEKFAPEIDGDDVAPIKPVKKPGEAEEDEDLLGVDEEEEEEVEVDDEE